MRVINPTARHPSSWSQMEASKEISKERNRRPVRYWLNCRTQTQWYPRRRRALKVGLMVLGVGEVVGVFHMFIYVMCLSCSFCKWSESGPIFCWRWLIFVTWIFEPMGWNLHFHLLIEDRLNSWIVEFISRFCGARLRGTCLHFPY